MRLGLYAAALLAAVSVSSIAQATHFDFAVDAGGADEFTPFMQGTGSFDTAGSDGTFTLASGLDDFSFDGVEGSFLFGGYLSLTEADLASFSVTLDHGALTSLSFISNVLTVPQLFIGWFDAGLPNANVQFAVDGLAPGNFAFATDVSFGLDADGNLLPIVGMVGPITGDLTLSTAAVPEPASWAMMLGGFGLIGGAMRSRRKAAVSFG